MKRAFTLIELLLVIGILGVLASMLVVNLPINREQAMADVAAKELADIQAAFQTFAADVSFRSNRRYYNYAARCGLAPLLERARNGEYEFPEWSNEGRIGWNGPYIMPEGTTRTYHGIDDLPVIETPEAATRTDGCYYRIIATRINNANVEEILPYDHDYYADTEEEIRCSRFYVVYPFWLKKEYNYIRNRNAEFPFEHIDEVEESEVIFDTPDQKRVRRETAEDNLRRFRRRLL